MQGNQHPAAFLISTMSPLVWMQGRINKRTTNSYESPFSVGFSSKILPILFLCLVYLSRFVFFSFRFQRIYFLSISLYLSQRRVKIEIKHKQRFSIDKHTTMSGCSWIAIVCGLYTINNNFLVKNRVKSLISNQCIGRCVQMKSREQMLSHSHCKTHFVIIAIEIDFSYEKRSQYVHLQL